MQLLMGMSMRRYFPAIGTAGFARSLVNGCRRDPRPPPMMTPRTSFIDGMAASIRWGVTAHRTDRACCTFGPGRRIVDPARRDGAPGLQSASYVYYLLIFRNWRTFPETNEINTKGYARRISKSINTKIRFSFIVS